MNPLPLIESAVAYFKAELAKTVGLPAIIVTSDINRQYKAGNFLIYVRLSSIETINDNLNCPIQRCRISLELVYPDTNSKAYEVLYQVWQKIHTAYTSWEIPQDGDTKGWVKATNYLVGDGTTGLAQGLGVGMTASFEIDWQGFA